MPHLPPEFLNSLEGLPGFDRTTFVDAHRIENRVTSLRLNPFKPVELDFSLNGNVPWCGTGRYLSERPSFTHDPLFHAGCYYVQEPGSMFLETAMRQTLELDQPLRVLDTCAAPGGKSTLINSLLNAESLLVSNEVVKSRANVLAENLSRWGTANSVVTNNEMDRFSQFEGFFDAVVVDAPCSGSGLFRKQPEAVDEWSPEAVLACSLRQRKILESIIPTIKTGGHLFYATCSYSAEENEQIVEWLSTRGFTLVKLAVPNDWGIVESSAGYRFYPNRTLSEGFFLATLIKTADQPEARLRFSQTLTAASRDEKAASAAYVSEPDQLFRIGARVHCANAPVKEFLQVAGTGFYFRKAGMAAGELKGRDFVPDQELAWAANPPKNVKKLDLQREMAVQYLKKSVILPPPGVTGTCLVTYKGQGLGWGKALNNRFNNYLPNSLKILH